MTAGVLIQLSWANPYRQPPNGIRVLAEIFRLETDPDARKVPEEFMTLSTLGDGYGISFVFLSEPPKQRPPEVLASLRKQRAQKRIEKKYPLFADQFMQAELERKPEYYAGITRADLQAAKDETLSNEKERLEFLSKNAGKVIVYGKSHSLILSSQIHG